MLTEFLAAKKTSPQGKYALFGVCSSKMAKSMSSLIFLQFSSQLLRLATSLAYLVFRA